MKVIYTTLILLSLLSLTTKANSDLTKTYALFSPTNGEKAFEIIYNKISNAKNNVYLTIYSWSAADLEESINKACENGAKVYGVIHAPLLKSSRVRPMVERLEMGCTTFKSSYKKMHEKFVIVDDQFLVNSSANFSNSAKSKYDETFVFFEGQNINEKYSNILNQFKKEFETLWNISQDFKSKNNIESEKLSFERTNFISKDNDIKLVSSMSNYNYKSRDEGLNGKFTIPRYKKVNKKKTWVVRDAVIDEVNKAQHTIHLNLNHFYIKEIADAILNAAARGIEIYYLADNQEFKPSSKREMTPYFVKQWKKRFKTDAPVRIKYYAHNPVIFYSRMNHNKTILIDYNQDSEALITGSYNFSKTAEHTQSDNLVFYKGEAVSHLAKSTYKDFMRLWTLNRGENPLQNAKEIFGQVSKYDSISLHSKKSITLEWNEVFKLRKYIRSEFGLNFSLKDVKNCLYFNVKTKEFSLCK